MNLNFTTQQRSSCCICKHLSYETKTEGKKGFDPRCDKKNGIIIHLDYGKKGCKCFELGILSYDDLNRGLKI